LVKAVDPLKMPLKGAIPLLTVLVVGYILPVSEGTADIDECDDNPCLYGGQCKNEDGGYKCVCEIGTAGENCQQKSIFRAYSDEEGCGLEGANHNWDICGEKDGNCLEELDNTSLCQYGKANRTMFIRKPFKTRDCKYNYYAEYTCKGEEGDTIIGKWTHLYSNKKNDTISCTKKNEDQYECASENRKKVLSIQWKNGIFSYTLDKDGGKHYFYGGFTNDQMTFSIDELNRGEIVDWMTWAKSGAETTTLTPDPEISTPASTEDPDTNPGIECCEYFNVDSECFPFCKQLDIPVNNTVDSRDMTCKKFSGVINECKNGSSGWKLHKCCKKYDVSKRCRPVVCDGECKEKPWEIDGTSTGDEECDKYVDDVSTCCGPN